MDFPDTIFCNNDTAVISVLDGLGFVQGRHEYIVTAEYSVGLNIISRANLVPDTILPGSPIIDIYQNNTSGALPVDYVFTPRITDTRSPDHDGEFCGGVPYTIRIWINPTPGIDVDVPDTIICDNNNVVININQIVC